MEEIERAEANMNTEPLLDECEDVPRGLDLHQAGHFSRKEGV